MDHDVASIIRQALLVGAEMPLVVGVSPSEGSSSGGSAAGAYTPSHLSST
jgi:hypothetical protein